MFCIVKDKEFYEVLWDEISTDEFISPFELEPVFIETFDPSLILDNELYLFFIDDNEGICGKVTFSHTSHHPKGKPLISIDQPLTNSALIIKDVDYHINGESPIHEDAEAFEVLTQRFYREILKNALWICRKLSINHIITISSTMDDHEDLSLWGDFKFSTFWETPQGILGMVSIEEEDLKQRAEPEAYAHSIKTISPLTIFKEDLID